MTASSPERTARRPPWMVGLERLGLAILSALVGVNIWTGSPLLALWVGSRVQGDSGLSMGALFAVVGVFAVMVLALAMALSWLSAKYDQVSGRPPAARRTSPWMRSMRGERSTDAARRHGISAVERIVVVTVVIAVVAFEAWFFFFSGSSLPHGT